jgi:hypothetical protein
MRTIQRSRQRLADAIVYERGLAEVGKSCCAEGGTGGLTDGLIGGSADQQVAFLESVGEDERLS